MKLTEEQVRHDRDYVGNDVVAVYAADWLEQHAEITALRKVAEAAREAAHGVSSVEEDGTVSTSPMMTYKEWRELRKAIADLDALKEAADADVTATR